MCCASFETPSLRHTASIIHHHKPIRSSTSPVQVTSLTTSKMFELANNYSSYHLIPQSSDLALSPPESYFFITDFLIISCGVLYTPCYLFYMTRTYSDRFLAGSVLFLSQTMAYELYYAYVCTTTTWQRVCFLVWFMCDVRFVAVALMRASR